MAATDWLTEVTPLEIPAAAAAGRRQDVRGDEQAAHQACPQDEVGDDQLRDHEACIGAIRTKD